MFPLIDSSFLLYAISTPFFQNVMQYCFVIFSYERERGYMGSALTSRGLRSGSSHRFLIAWVTEGDSCELNTGWRGLLLINVGRLSKSLSCPFYWLTDLVPSSLLDCFQLHDFTCVCVCVCGRSQSICERVSVSFCLFSMVHSKSFVSLKS